MTAPGSTGRHLRRYTLVQDRQAARLGDVQYRMTEMEVLQRYPQFTSHDLRTRPLCCGNVVIRIHSPRLELRVEEG
jgi:hypothetical protein